MKLLFLICCLFVVIASLANAEDEAPKTSIKLPKVFNFETFKHLYNKQYGFWENVARKSIYLGHAFRAFISRISYKNKKSDTYLAVNRMSDWTDDEYRRTIPKQHNKVDQTEKLKVDVDKTLVAKETEIKETLEEIIEKHKDEPGYKDIVAELEAESKTSSVRRKRAIEGDDETPIKQHHLSPKDAVKLASRSGASFLKDFISKALKPYKEDSKTTKYTPSPTETRIVIDHRQSGCITPARAQGPCGSCYIFATLSLYEWIYCINSGGKREMFSEQYILDCGHKTGSAGCEGGSELEVGSFVESFGLDVGYRYTYKAELGQCPYSDDEPNSKQGSIRTKKIELTNIALSEFKHHLKETPILVGIYLTPGFREYGGGIEQGKECDREEAHSVLIIGWGVQNGQEYWLMKNSYGTDWGEHGYFRLNMNAEKCIMHHRVAGVIANRRPEEVKFRVNTKQNKEAMRNVYFNGRNPLEDIEVNTLTSQPVSSTDGNEPANFHYGQNTYSMTIPKDDSNKVYVKINNNDKDAEYMEFYQNWKDNYYDNLYIRS